MRRQTPFEPDLKILDAEGKPMIVVEAKGPGSGAIAGLKSYWVFAENRYQQLDWPGEVLQPNPWSRSQRPPSPPERRQPGQDRPRNDLRIVASSFGFVSMLLPTRLANEEFGDALEDIHRRADKGDPVWHLYLVMVSAIFWAFVHAPKYVLSSGEKKRGAGKD